MDNLTLAKEDRNIVTGKENKAALEKRIANLQSLLKWHPQTQANGEELRRNYEEGMSFNDLQIKFFENLKDRSPSSGFRTSHDYAEYLAVKEYAQKNPNMLIRTLLPSNTMPNEYQNMTIGDAFATLFPQADTQ